MLSRACCCHALVGGWASTLRNETFVADVGSSFPQAGRRSKSVECDAVRRDSRREIFRASYPANETGKESRERLPAHGCQSLSV